MIRAILPEDPAQPGWIELYEVVHEEDGRYIMSYIANFFSWTCELMRIDDIETFCIAIKDKEGLPDGYIYVDEIQRRA